VEFVFGATLDLVRVDLAGACPFFPIDRRAPLGAFERIAEEYPVFRVAAAI
jgi:hypothetical protein